ncbi:cytochrome o ubiquinol oxidase subunit IV [bacterium]|nr:cytochrome o ubiquinol oxidase subunit IV [bacterium]NBX98178.1 cytochrome o ubiquinol oxidase subunit IV [bacterium]NDD84409.1 cytochrome o ubiquinol oxidase subunit IV [bacterium]NDG28970.1 cytochrome o ubiquinol oxidase subunit IV [bacterium]
MSHQHVAPQHNNGSEHGTVKSYVIGFLLSLLFTFIPYVIVVNQVVTGTKLLITILGFGVIQAIIQVTFFLHLGRGPKPNWNQFFFVSTIAIILIVVGGSIIIIQNLHYNMSPQDKVKKIANDENIYQVGGKETGACKVIGKNHIVVIRNGEVKPLLTTTKKCDTLSFVNNDDKREITFGAHPNHDVYAGETELVIRKGRSKTITLSEVGTFQFHDHLQPGTAGNFIVKP